MNIEDITQEALNKLQDTELKHLRARANQVFKSIEQQSKLAKQKELFLEKYKLIVDEMQKRNLEFKWTSNIDKELFKRAVYGIDITKLKEVQIKEDFISLTGNYLEDPKHHNGNVEIVIKTNSDDTAQDLELKIRAQIVDSIGDKLAFLYGTDREYKTSVGLYDLVLKPKESLERRNLDNKEPKEKSQDEDEDFFTVPHPILKPFPNEHAARQTSPSKYDSFASKKLGKGIRAILGIKGGKSEIQSIRFSAKKWTVAEAKAWLKEHDFKTGVEAASGKKKSINFSVIRKEEERGLVGGIVYRSVADDASVKEIDEVLDADNEFTTKEWLEKAAYEYMIYHQRMLRQHDMSKGAQPIYIVENFVTDEDTIKSGETIPANSWFLLCQVDLSTEAGKEIWKEIRDGNITGFSLGGRAMVEEVEGE